MSLREYQDPALGEELGPELGEYVKSYSWGDGSVELHVFRATDGEVTVFLMKSPSLPLSVAQNITRSTLDILEAQEGHRPRVVLDANSLPRTGSL